MIDLKVCGIANCKGVARWAPNVEIECNLIPEKAFDYALLYPLCDACVEREDVMNAVADMVNAKVSKSLMEKYPETFKLGVEFELTIKLGYSDLSEVLAEFKPPVLA